MEGLRLCIICPFLRLEGYDITEVVVGNVSTPTANTPLMAPYREQKDTGKPICVHWDRCGLPQGQYRRDMSIPLPEHGIPTESFLKQAFQYVGQIALTPEEPTNTEADN